MSDAPKCTGQRWRYKRRCIQKFIWFKDMFFPIYVTHENLYFFLYFPASGTLTVTPLLGVTFTEAHRSSGSSVPCPNVLKVQLYKQRIKWDSTNWTIRCFNTFVSLCVFTQISTENVCWVLVCRTGAQHLSLRAALDVSLGTYRL